MPLGPNPAHRARPASSLHDDWQLRVEGAWLNDNFTPVTTNDDNGFTNDGYATITAQKNQTRLQASIADRMLTERGGMRRTDVVDTAFSASQTYEVGNFALSGTATAGLATSGDYAGAPVQDWFHGTVGYGRRLHSLKGNTYYKTPLQDTYDGQRRFGLTLGGDTSLSYGFFADHVRAEAGVEAQAALGGTGVSYLRPHTGIDARLSYGPLAANAGARVELTRALTRDPSLTIPGGYNTRTPYVTIETHAGASVWLLEGGVRARFNDAGTGFHTAGAYVAVGLP